MYYLGLLIAGLLPFAAAIHAETSVTVERNDSLDATPEYKFKAVPLPVQNDAAAKASFTLVDGHRDPNGGGLAVLQDGRVPTEEDMPAENFFFRAGTDGGRIQVNLSNATDILRVSTYSWHGATRGPQVYKLYGAQADAPGLNLEPKKETDPASCGWKLLASVDTRPKTRNMGGQYGVHIANPEGTLGKFQYLLFDVSRTEDTDAFGNTFFSEIDIVEQNGPTLVPVKTPTFEQIRDVVEIDGGYTAIIDTTKTPELTEWARTNVAPMLRKWYPELVRMLPSEGYTAPQKFSIVFDPAMRGVAETSGTRVRCAGKWMRDNLKGESLGAIFHEVVHVVQQYGQARRVPGATRAPGWLTEGITDYIRFYQFEPQTKGAEITQRNLSRARYDGSYRITANFLNWVSQKHGQDFVKRLNAIIREGKYNEDKWREISGGQSLPDLGAAWKTELEQRLSQKSL